VEAGLIDQDFDCLRPFLCLFEALIDGSCPNFNSRVPAYLQRFVDTVKLNISYYKWMEVIFEFIFKILLLFLKFFFMLLFSFFKFFFKLSDSLLEINE
jgi:hypothetical protein